MAINEASRSPHVPIIVCVSVSHRNTARIADVIGQEMSAEVVTPTEADPARLLNAELVGFGSGIFYQNFHPELREFVSSLQPRTDRRAFVFFTSGFPAPPWSRYPQRFVDALQHKGFQLAGSFDCRGWDTWLPFKPVGGHNKGRPRAADLDAARTFARRLTLPDSPSRGIQ